MFDLLLANKNFSKDLSAERDIFTKLVQKFEINFRTML